MLHVALSGGVSAGRVICSGIGYCCGRLWNRTASCEVESVFNVGGGACNGSGWLVSKRLLLWNIAGRKFVQDNIGSHDRALAMSSNLQSAPH